MQRTLYSYIICITAFVCSLACPRLLAAEECAPGNCVGQRIAAGLLERGVSARTTLVNTGPGFVTHGSVGQLRALCGLDGASLYQKALEVCGHGNG